MKLRKHINNKRLEVLEMVGRDRIIHMQARKKYFFHRTFNLG